MERKKNHKQKSERRRMADKNKSGDFYDRPEKVSGWAGFTQFIWNGESKQFMGRTGISWGKFCPRPIPRWALIDIFLRSWTHIEVERKCFRPSTKNV